MESERTKKTEVTITRDEFRETASETMAKFTSEMMEKDADPMLFMFLTLNSAHVIAKLDEAFFGENKEKEEKE